MGEIYDESDQKTYREFHMNVNEAYYARPVIEGRAVKLELPSVTLICADCVHIEYAIPALERCKAFANFGAVKLLTSMPTDYEHRVPIMPLNSLSAYSTFMLKQVYAHVDTTHMLVAQHDGWIINPEAWDPAWLGCDYIGPLFIHEHKTAPTSVGSGGFSLRSKRLMQHVSGLLPAWDGSEVLTKKLMGAAGSYEDGYISITKRAELERAGFVFGTVAQASRFAQGGNNDPAQHVAKPFGFHGLWSNINHTAGEVAPPPFRG